MDRSNPQSQTVVVLATDQLDPGGSVVRSGLMLAEAVLRSFETAITLEVVFDGIKGASSSYFNVFLRRIDEGCGLDVFEARACLRFATRIQEAMYSRSLESVRRGRREPPQAPVVKPPADEVPKRSTQPLRSLRAFLKRAAGGSGRK